MNKKNIIESLNNSVVDYINQNKSMIGFILIFLSFIIICDRLDSCSKNDCSDSILDMNSTIKECFSGAKLKFENNQWICHCENK